jgi:hypothetical protein
MIAKSALLRRRAVLRFAVGAAGTATILCAPSSSTIAAPKISKTAVAYQDHPNGDKRCDKCLQFQAPDACKMVEGPISPQGSCRIFSPLRQT